MFVITVQLTVYLPFLYQGLMWEEGWCINIMWVELILSYGDKHFVNNCTPFHIGNFQLSDSQFAESMAFVSVFVLKVRYINCVLMKALVRLDILY